MTAHGGSGLRRIPQPKSVLICATELRILRILRIVRIAKSITYVFSAAIEVVPCYKARYDGVFPRPVTLIRPQGSNAIALGVDFAAVGYLLHSRCHDLCATQSQRRGLLRESRADVQGLGDFAEFRVKGPYLGARICQTGGNQMCVRQADPLRGKSPSFDHLANIL